MKSAVAYARVSTQEKAQGGFSIEGQIKDIRAFAEKLGCTLVNIYADEGDTAYEDATKRPMFMSMAREAEKKDCSFEAVIVWDHSRFARNTDDAVKYMSTFRRNNINVYFVHGSANSHDPFGTFSDHIMFGVAELDSAIKAERVMTGSKEGASQGYAMGGPPPYGMQKITVTTERGKDKKKYAPYEPEARVVRKIYEWYASGLSLYKIIWELEKEGIKPRYGNKWSRYTLKRILEFNRDIYLGHMVYNRFCKRKRMKQHLRDESEWVYHHNAHEPVITQDMADSVALARKGRRVFAERTGPVPLMLGLLTCGICGNAITVQHGKYKATTYNYYVCSKYRKAWHQGKKDSCSNAWHRQEHVDELVAQHIQEQFLDDEILSRLVKAHNKRKEKSLDTSKVKEGQLLKAQAEMLKRKERLLESIEQGIVLPSEARERMEVIRKSLESINDDLSHSRGVSGEVFDIDMRAMIEMLKSNINSPKLQQHLINTLVKGGIMYPTEVHLTYHFPTDYEDCITF